jgi:hypothetical protein
MLQAEVVDKIKTHVLFSITEFRNSRRLSDNVKKYGRTRRATDGNVIRRMHFACWLAKATDRHSQCVILIAFPRQQWLRERASVLRLRTVPVVSCPVWHQSAPHSTVFSFGLCVSHAESNSHCNRPHPDADPSAALCAPTLSPYNVCSRCSVTVNFAALFTPCFLCIQCTVSFLLSLTASAW